MEDDRAGGDGRGADGLLAELSARLPRTPSGLAFVYEALDTLVARLSLADAVLITDNPATGRQAFRAGRRPVAGAWAGGLAAEAQPGLYTEPAALAPALAEGVIALAETALRLDLLGHDATHDPLTGLLNRRSFDSLLDQALARSRRYGWPFALVMFDLNRFKALNDRHGHAAGDRVLRLIGAVLRANLRAGDVAARLGGDEFAVMLTRGDAATARMLASRVTARVNADFEWADIEFAIGVARAPAEGVDAEALTRLADTRLYEEKAS